MDGRTDDWGCLGLDQILRARPGQAGLETKGVMRTCVVNP